jgi:pimeloyl-ACP methyl ester carboxylesterase
MSTNPQDGSRPTVVLVHGAFADASSWNDVIERLQADGVQATAPANPLRGISIDSAYSASLLDQIQGPVLAADLPAKQTAVMAATQRPVAESAFSEPSGEPAWKNLPSWAVVSSGDKAVGSDVVRSMAERAGATITEVEGSHVIMMSQPQAVADVILSALAAASQREEEALNPR